MSSKKVGKLFKLNPTFWSMANYDLEVINGIIQVSLYFEIGFKDINIKPVEKELILT